MTKRVLSIDIGVINTRICEMDYGKKTPHIYKCITFRTPDNAIEDGYIRDKQVLAAVLRKKLDEADMKLTDVVFTVSSTRIANREIVIPMVKDRLIQPVVDAGAQEYFPVDVSEYIISYSILERIITKESRQLKLLLLAAPGNLIKNYYSFAQLMNFTILAIDYIGNSGFQLLKRQSDEGIRCIIQINEQSTLIHVIDHETLLLQRTIPYGTNAVVEAALENKAAGQEKEEEIFKLLCEKELINSHFDPFQEAAATDEALADQNPDSLFRNAGVITDSLRYLVNNVTRVLDYYNSKFPEKRIDKIHITGQGSKIKGIVQLFQNEIGYEVKILDRFLAVVFHKGMNLDDIDQTAYMSAIGAVLKPIGFVSKDIIEKEAKKSGRSILLLTVIGSLSISVVLIAVSTISLQGAKSEKRELEAQIKTLTPVEAVFSEYTAALNDYQNIANMYALTTSKNEKLNGLINELEEKLPSSAVVSALAVSETGLSMNITTNNKISAAKLYLQLSHIEDLSDISIASIAESEDDNGIKMVTFAVNCQYSSKTEEANVPEENSDNGK
ncbi:pilus assembly protein PilM [Anaerocolumna xylanovorans]|uniref:Type IV pilus assembly protein PilM n=1 Tax=Anaerocolumna xylanovorans DSM 12503 TaxID=1121345 RepID=A0A1M7YMR9_9FIRM|nr:pilus assembly protein PilM [Anaerocolumna xylanovorans]SHO53939.1 type IV pilus assembly protein PilM [Anaerocolumna xylanovorans DSM 12503]